MQYHCQEEWHLKLTLGCASLCIMTLLLNSASTKTRKVQKTLVVSIWKQPSPPTLRLLWFHHQTMWHWVYQLHLPLINLQKKCPTKSPPAVERRPTDKSVLAESKKQPTREASTLDGMLVGTKPAPRPSAQKCHMDSKKGNGSSKKSRVENKLVHAAQPPIPFVDDDSFMDKSVDSLPDSSWLPKCMPSMRWDVAPKNPFACTMIKGKKIVGNPKLSASYSLAAAVSHKILDFPFRLALLVVEYWCKHLAGMEMEQSNLLGKINNMLNLVLSP